MIVWTPILGSFERRNRESMPVQYKLQDLLKDCLFILLKPDVNRSSEQRDLFVWSSIGRRRNIQARVGWAISKRRVPTIVPVIIFQQIWGAFVSTSYLRIKQWVPCLYTWSLCSTRESSGWSFGTSEEKIYPGWNKQNNISLRIDGKSLSLFLPDNHDNEHWGRRNDLLEARKLLKCEYEENCLR